MIERFEEIVWNGPPKIVRGYFHDELSAFFVCGGRLHVPFGDMPKTEPGWVVVHQKTGRTATRPFQRQLSFAKACAFSKMIEDAYGGWSQIANSGDVMNPLVGWDGEPKRILAQVTLQFAKQYRHALKADYRERIEAAASEEHAL